MKLNTILFCAYKNSKKPLVGELTKKTSNLPDSYIKRAMEQIVWKTPKAVQYRQVTTGKLENFYFGEDRPWTMQFKENNIPGKRMPKVFVEPVVDWTFFNELVKHLLAYVAHWAVILLWGDRVEILVGKDKGKQGIINYIVQERNWVYVDGLNCTFKYIGKDKKRNYPGQMYPTELPLLVTSEVALIDPFDNKPTKCEFRFTEEGERVRVSVRTDRVIPIPKMAEETVDYKLKSTYKEQPKDTVEADVTSVTFVPQLKTFDMDIMDRMGIYEDRIRAKSYWYCI